MLTDFTKFICNLGFEILDFIDVDNLLNKI